MSKKKRPSTYVETSRGVVNGASKRFQRDSATNLAAYYNKMVAEKEKVNSKVEKVNEYDILINSSSYARLTKQIIATNIVQIIEGLYRNKNTGKLINENEVLELYSLYHECREMLVNTVIQNDLEWQKNMENQYMYFLRNDAGFVLNKDNSKLIKVNMENSFLSLEERIEYIRYYVNEANERINNSGLTLTKNNTIK